MSAHVRAITPVLLVSHAAIKLLFLATRRIFLDSLALSNLYRAGAGGLSCGPTPEPKKEPT